MGAAGRAREVTGQPARADRAGPQTPRSRATCRSSACRWPARSERPNLPWTFGVVDDPTPNAFALPGGFIFFTRGMMA
jgi:predicted Zn-dependent protease